MYVVVLIWELRRYLGTKYLGRPRLVRRRKETTGRNPTVPGASFWLNE